jgi:hypothetical protein
MTFGKLLISLSILSISLNLSATFLIVDYSIVNGTKGTDDFYSGGTITLLNTNNTLNLTYTLSVEKPLYVGRFYSYDNIDELNNNEDLIKNVALK